MKLLQKLSLASILFLLSTQFSVANITYYLKLGELTKGGTVTKGYEDYIRLHSYGWAAQNNVDIGSISGGGGAGKAAFSPLQIVAPIAGKYVPDLFLALCEGTPIADAEIVAVSEGAVSRVIFKIELKLVMSSQVYIEATDGDQAILNASLDFGACQITTYEQNPDGSQGEENKKAWSIVNNRAEFSVD